MAKDTKMIPTPIPSVTTERAAREERLSLHLLWAVIRWRGIAAFRATTRFMGSFGEMTLPQSKAPYLKDPKAIVPAKMRTPRPTSPTRTLAARTALPMGSVWQKQAAPAGQGLLFAPTTGASTRRTRCHRDRLRQPN